MLLELSPPMGGAIKATSFGRGFFTPVLSPDQCTSCGTCVDICPPKALSLNSEDVLDVDYDKCFGCGLCASSCDETAISMDKKEDAIEPPANMHALKQAVHASRNK
ncbi:MAG: 4Fe-4S dicluster domain-containing protein [Desulfobacterales bacterium]|nr:4Fe-4S dicluster domain-containing protein [Desulfobacterales bacterium]